MKKFFLALCLILWESGFSSAKIVEISDQSAAPRPQQQVQNEKPKVKSMSQEELRRFLEERVKTTVIEDADQVSSASISSVSSPEVQKAREEQNKSEFQKIYEQALAKVVMPQRPAEVLLPGTAPQISSQQQNWQKPDFPVIEAVLPDSPEKVLIPAREHIPYLMTQIDILPEGTVKFEETVTVVANGDKISTLIHKSLPDAILLRDGSRQNIDYTFIGATINGIPAHYRIERRKNGFLLSPKKEEPLNPGVYTFRFAYLAHNLMGLYPDFDEFYWDVTGSSWNLVIGKTGAVVTYPQAGEPLGQIVLLGSPTRLSTNGGNIVRLSPVSFGYRAARPLFIGEGFHIISSLPHGIVAAPDWSDRWFAAIEKNSDAFFCGLSLLMIIIGFLVSGRYIRRNVGQLKVSLKKNAPLMRYLHRGRYDIKAFASFLLELYKKNIIDIQQAEETILLVKRTDQPKNLSLYEQKALQALFGPNDAVFNANKNNLVKIRRAARYIEKELRLALSWFRLRLNSGYILFSLGMLFAGEICAALFAENPGMLQILVPGTLLLVAGCLLFYVQSTRNLWPILAKAVGTALILLTLAVLAAVVSVSAVLLIFVSVLVIFYFTTGYTTRNGLLKPYIDETEALKLHLRKHHDNILLGKEIINQQANILALDMEEDFIPDKENEYCKLPTMKELVLRFK